MLNMENITDNDIQEFNNWISSGYQKDAIPFSSMNRCKRLIIIFVWIKYIGPCFHIHIKILIFFQQWDKGRQRSCREMDYCRKAYHAAQHIPNPTVIRILGNGNDFLVQWWCLLRYIWRYFLSLFQCIWNILYRSYFICKLIIHYYNVNMKWYPWHDATSVLFIWRKLGNKDFT